MPALTFAQLNQLNAGCVCVLGIGLNAVLGWAIWRNTPNEMRTFARILAQGCAFDSVNVLIYAIIIPVYLLDGDVLTYWASNSVSIELLPSLLVHSLAILWLILNGTVLWQSGLQSLYRYLSLVWDWTAPLWLYLAMLIVPNALMAIAFLVDQAPDPGRLRNPALAESLGMVLPPKQGFTSRIQAESTPFQVILRVGSVWEPTNFALGLGCAALCSVHVYRNYKGPNEKKRRDVNRQLNLNLFLQAILPAIVGGLSSLTFIQHLIYLGGTNTSITAVAIQDQQPQPGASTEDSLTMAFSTFVQTWLPVLNPLVTLLAIRAYRQALARAIVRLFCWPCKTGGGAKVGPLAGEMGIGQGNNNNNKSILGPTSLPPYHPPAAVLYNNEHHNIIFVQNLRQPTVPK